MSSVGVVPVRSVTSEDGRRARERGEGGENTRLSVRPRNCPPSNEVKAGREATSIRALEGTDERNASPRAGEQTRPLHRQ